VLCVAWKKERKIFWDENIFTDPKVSPPSRADRHGIRWEMGVLRGGVARKDGVARCLEAVQLVSVWLRLNVCVCRWLENGSVVAGLALPHDGGRRQGAAAIESWVRQFVHVSEERADAVRRGEEGCGGFAFARHPVSRFDR